MKTLLLGDLYHTQKNAEQFKNQDMEALFNDTLPMFQGNDICFVNLECAITESENAILKYGPNLKVVRETADIMKKLGVTLCGLSNNNIFTHYLDCEAHTDVWRELFKTANHRNER